MQAFIVENGVVVDSVMVPSRDWPVGEGRTLVVSDVGGIGWVYERGELIQPRQPVDVPDSVPALAGLLALDAAGFGPQYQAWAADPARTFAERAFIDKAMTWRRDDPTVLAAAEALALGSEQVDALFIQAGALA